MKLFSMKHILRHTPVSIQKPILESPYRLWRSMFSLFLMVSIAAVAAGVFLYYRVSSNVFLQGEDATFSREPINRAKLESVLERYSKKKNEFETLKTQQPVVGDPSI